MDAESPEIVQARKHLSSFEKRMMDDDSIHYLSEGLLLLENALEHSTSCDLAKNLGDTYTVRICSKISDLLQEPNLTTEPKLEHLLRLLLEIDDSQFGDKERISKLKEETVKKLFGKIFRGYSDEEKQGVLKRLLKKGDT